MNLRKIIIFSSLASALIATTILSLTYFIPSYNSWKKTYDTVIEENENAKYDNIGGVIVKDVSLEKISFRPCYVISGKYDETVDPDTLSFKLYTYEERANYAEIVKKEINEEKKTFKMYTDVSLASADGDGNSNYDHDSSTNVLPDNPNIHALYPKLVIGNVEKDLVSTHVLWENKTLEYKDCKYEIKHNDDTSVFPFAMPALVKKTEQVIPEDAVYTATGVEFCQYEEDVCYILHGTSQGYNRDTLSKAITFELRVSNNKTNIWAIRGTQGGPVIMENDGSWMLYVRLNNIPSSGTNAYYTRFGENFNEKGDIADLKVPGINGTEDQQSIIEGNRKYTIFINHGTTAASGYGTTGVKVIDI